MLNGVSNVSFRASERKAWNDPNVNFDAPQAYPRQAESATQAEPKKKSNKFLKTVAGLVVAAAVVMGALAAGSKYGKFNVAKIAEKLPESVKDSKYLQWAKQPFIKAMEWADGAGLKIRGWRANCLASIKNKSKTSAEPPAETPAAPETPVAAEAPEAPVEP